MEAWRKENIVTLIVSGSVILGLFAMSGDFNSLWGLSILLNLNYPKGGTND